MANIPTATFKVIMGYRRALEAGEAYAKGLKVGDRFLGVMPEAAQRFDREEHRNLFMMRALDLLPGIYTDRNNIITRIERDASN